jgi:hypothetical protein
MSITKQCTFRQFNKIVEALPEHIVACQYFGLEYLGEKVMVRHFEPGNESAYNYPKLDPKYLARKRKKYGNVPTLVATGTLRDDVTSRYRIIRRRGKMIMEFTAPSYGRFVIVRGFDWKLLNERDLKDLHRVVLQTLKKIRKQFVSSV